MNDKVRNIFILSFFFSLIFYTAFLFNNAFKNKTSDLIASVFFQKSVDTKELIGRYEDNLKTKNKNDQKQGNIKIMIVPGHDNKNFGASFGNVTEADLNLQVAGKLKKLLENEKGLEVSMIRDKNGFDSDFQKFRENNKSETLEFVNSKKEIMRDLINEGKIEGRLNSHGNVALPQVVETLYAINHYVSLNNFDMVIHIHFNDYPGRSSQGGKHNGFAIYVPDDQYSNAEASYDFAVKIKNQLEVSFPESSLPKEDAITEDQEYIAIGAYNTADPISILIEYGYIYEPQFTDDQFGNIVLSELATQTYFGVINYLKNEDNFSDRHYDSLKDHAWTRDLKNGDEGLDVLALQSYLRKTGYYPYNDDLNACPMTGYFGNCTEKSLTNFQKDNGILPTGYYGELTRAGIVD